MPMVLLYLFTCLPSLFLDIHHQDVGPCRVESMSSQLGTMMVRGQEGAYALKIPSKLDGFVNATASYWIGTPVRCPVHSVSRNWGRVGLDLAYPVVWCFWALAVFVR